MSLFYAFLLNQWMFNGMDEETLNSYVPRFISAEEAEKIMLAPKA